ncbi:molecular chaperone [Vibrio cholerae]|nr:molecular chaperone [Vibrio cholerae]EJY5650602.1 molecular chaperone [Vibrio cholerae]EKF9785702.1 molecular chaperone [Vibrio cholerae]
MNILSNTLFLDSKNPISSAAVISEKTYSYIPEVNVNIDNSDPKELFNALLYTKSLVLNGMEQNIEQQISNSLLDAIDKSAAELEDFKAWTDGGNSVISPIIDLMYENLIKDDTNNNKSEDLMQLLVFDFLLHQDEWGLNDILTNDEREYLGYITENFGSGMHSVYKGYEENTPDKIVNWFLNTFCKRLESSGKIPDDSACFKILSFFKEEVNKNKLVSLGNDYTRELQSVDTSNINLSNSISKSESSTHVSPTLKFFLLAQGAKEGILSANDWAEFINSDIEGIKKLLGLEGGDKTIADWLADVNKNTGWTYDSSGQLDFNRGQEGGIPIVDLLNFFKGFPSRVLSDDELKEVNRIGDNVKMIMQTLKYWFQILRDERVAIARNI